MKMITIYEEGEYKVEVPAWFDYAIKHLTPQQNKLSEKFLERMIPLVYAKLSAEGVEIKTPDKAYSSVAPIFAYGTGVIFKKPFDVFGEVQEFICSVEDIHKEKDFIRDGIEFYNETSLPPDTNIHFQIFERPYANVDGWLAYASPERIIILFWSYDSPINLLNDNEDFSIEEL